MNELRGKVPSDAVNLRKTVHCLKSYTKNQIESKIRTLKNDDYDFEAAAPTEAAPAAPAAKTAPVAEDPKKKRAMEAKKAEEDKKEAKKQLGRERYTRMAGTVMEGLYSPDDVTSTRTGRLSLVPEDVEDDHAYEHDKFADSEDELVVKLESNKKPCLTELPEIDLRPRHLSSYPPKSSSSYSSSSYSYCSPTNASWADKMRQASPVRHRTFTNVIRLDPSVRCPWIDLYFHKEWVKIFAHPVPKGAQFELEARHGNEVYVIIKGDWNPPPFAPISASDLARSGRSSSHEYVFMFSFDNIPVDLGLDPIYEHGSDWHMFTFHRTDRY